MTTTAPKTTTAKEELAGLVLRHRVNELAFREGRISGPQFIACRNRLRSRMEALRGLAA